MAGEVPVDKKIVISKTKAFLKTDPLYKVKITDYNKAKLIEFMKNSKFVSFIKEINNAQHTFLIYQDEYEFLKPIINKHNKDLKFQNRFRDLING